MKSYAWVIHGMAFCVLLLVAQTAPAAWVVNEVPMQPDWSGDMELTDINSSGVACGYCETTGGYRVAFRYDGTTVTELPSLTENETSLATGINADGVICGYSYRPDGNQMERAVYWEGTTLHTVPELPDMGSYSHANDISDSGHIVGFYWNTNGARVAFYYEIGSPAPYNLDAAIRSIGLTDIQIASGINNSDLICGSANDPAAGGTTTAYTYDIDTGVPTLIGRMGTEDCSATDINKHGQTIGRGKNSPSDLYFRAVTYDGAWHFVDDDELAHQRVGGINDKGRMVVYSGATSTRKSWYSDGYGLGSKVYINLPGWTTLNVQEINNNDVIVGYGCTATSGTDERGFIIVPPPGDADHDGDIDLDDFAEFADCLSGPIDGAGFAPPSDDCLETFDFDPADGDVDMADFAAFQAAFEGS